jgi:hypothetical protein
MLPIDRNTVTILKEYRMGMASDWIGVRGLSAAEVLKVLALCDTGERVGYHEDDTTMLKLPNGWIIVQAEMGSFLDIDPIKQMTLGGKAEFVHALAEEHSMVSSAMYLNKAKLLWRAECSGGNLTIKMEKDFILDPEYEEIKERIEREAKENGYSASFEIPIAFAEKLTGFRYDRDVVLDDDEPYHVLEAVE